MLDCIYMEHNKFLCFNWISHNFDCSKTQQWWTVLKISTTNWAVTRSVQHTSLSNSDVRILLRFRGKLRSVPTAAPPVCNPPNIFQNETFSRNIFLYTQQNKYFTHNSCGLTNVPVLVTSHRAIRKIKTSLHDVIPIVVCRLRQAFGIFQNAGPGHIKYMLQGYIFCPVQDFAQILLQNKCSWRKQKINNMVNNHTHTSRVPWSA